MVHRGVTVTLIAVTFGLFGHSYAQCASNECNPGFFPEGISLVPDKACYSNGERVNITCSGSFGGPPFNFCDSDGNWDLPPPTCEVFNCSRQVTGEELILTPDKEVYVAREVVRYSCPQGYIIQGPSDAQCSPNNTWNPPGVPLCQVGCIVPVINNGDVNFNGPIADGDSTTVECDSGYSLEPGASSIITCVAGEWGTLPTCYASCDIPAVSFSDIVPTGVTIQHGETYTAMCQSGYSYNQQTFFTVGCNDGSLTVATPDQCFADCNPLPTPAYGSISGGNLHGQTVWYSCNRGFRLNGTVSAVCTDGMWDDDSTPVCEDLSLQDSISLICDSDKYYVEIPGELLGQNPELSDVLLGSCQGSYYDGAYMYANSSYTDCDTTIEVDSQSQTVTYRNTLTSVDPVDQKITTETYLELDVACAFDQNNLVTSSAIINAAILRDLDDSAKFDLTFRAYSDNGYTMEVTESSVVDTNSDIYLLVEVNYITNVDVFPTRCYATPRPEYNFHIFEDLVLEGCPASNLVDSVSTDVTSKPSLSFKSKVFRFTSEVTDRIYIHCELKICAENGCPLPAMPCSGSRRRRSTEINFSRKVSTGPIRMPSDETVTGTSSPWTFTVLTIYSALISTVMISAVAVAVLINYRKRSTQSLA